MRKKLALFILLFLASASLLHASDTSVSDRGREFASRSEALILRGEELSELLGFDLESLTVVAWHPTTGARLVPFQIDEKFPGGDFMFLANGFPETHRLSAQDELVMMVRDVGEKWQDAAPAFHTEFVEEVEVLDPVTGQRGYVYVASQAIPGVQSTLGHVEPFLESPRSTVFQQALRGNVSFFRGALTSPLSSSDFDLREAGEKQGPVRSLRKLRVRPALGYGVRMAPVTILTMDYEQMSVTDIRGKVEGFGMGWVSAFDLEIGPLRSARMATRVQINDLANSPFTLRLLPSDASCESCLRFRASGPVTSGAAVHFEIKQFFSPSYVAREPLRVRARVLTDHLASRGR